MSHPIGLKASPGATENISALCSLWGGNRRQGAITAMWEGGGWMDRRTGSCWGAQRGQGQPDKGTAAHRALVGGTVGFPLSAHTAPMPSMVAAAAPQPHWGSASIRQEVAPEGTPWWLLPVQTGFGDSWQLLQAVSTSVVTWALSDHPLLLPASPSWPRRASVSKQ